MNKHLYRLSRALVALIFVISGVGKVAGFRATVAMAGSAGLPLPEAAIGAAALIEIGAGLALLAGWHERWASLALIVFLIPATLMFHAAHLTDPVQGQMQMIETLKNLAILGALVRFAIEPAGYRELPAAVAQPRLDHQAEPSRLAS